MSFYILFILIFPLCFCQNDINNFFIQRHNDIRRNVNPPAEYMPDLVYDDALFRIASDHVNTCEFKHSSSEWRMKKYVDYGGELGNVWIGENIAYSYGVDPLKYAIEGWAGEVKHYNYDKNIGENGQVVGHYTQIVWAKTTRVGCAHNLCTKPDGQKFDFVVCNYAIGGNIVGERPYERKKTSNHQLSHEMNHLNIQPPSNNHQSLNHHNYQLNSNTSNQQSQTNQQNKNNVSNRIKELQNKIQSSNAKQPLLSRQPKSAPKVPPKKSFNNNQPSSVIPQQHHNQQSPVVIPPPLPPRENNNHDQIIRRGESPSLNHEGVNVISGYNIQFLNQPPLLQSNQTYQVQFTPLNPQNNVYQIHFQTNQQNHSSSSTPQMNYHHFNPFIS